MLPINPLPFYLKCDDIVEDNNSYNRNMNVNKNVKKCIAISWYTRVIINNQKKYKLFFERWRQI